MSDGNKPVSEDILLPWVDRFLLNNAGPFEKRLFDWWINEGFFCVSNFIRTEGNIRAELMLLLGYSVYDTIRSSEAGQVDNSSAMMKIEEKKNNGWDMVLRLLPNIYVLKDTENNRQKIEELLSDNIRRFNIVEFKTKTDNDITILNSVVIDVYRKR